MSSVYVLDLDVGNTRAKWRLSGGDAPVVRGFCSVPDLQGLDLDDISLGLVRVSSVRSGDFNRKLAVQIAMAAGVQPRFARAIAECAGVSSAYAEPATLGVDRWLAMLAAFSVANGPCLVVDAGSAITLDAVDGDGLHLGGYIVPGLSMQARSLLAGTNILAPDELSFAGVSMGCSTHTAIANGILSMVVAWIADAKRRAGGGSLFLTGGDAGLLRAGLSSLGLDHVSAPDLVLDGLALALPLEG